MFKESKNTVCADSLLQIYAKGPTNGKYKSPKKNKSMYINKKAIDELTKSLSLPARNIIFYCIMNMRTQADEFDTMSIELDFNNESCRSMITKNKKSFYDAIKELMESKFLLKWKPKFYLVHHGYISLLTDEHINNLKQEKYSTIQGINPDGWINNLKTPDDL